MTQLFSALLIVISNFPYEKFDEVPKRPPVVGSMDFESFAVDFNVVGVFQILSCLYTRRLYPRNLEVLDVLALG